MLRFDSYPVIVNDKSLTIPSFYFDVQFLVIYINSMIINLDLKEQENILIQTNHDTVFASKLMKKRQFQQQMVYVST